MIKFILNEDEVDTIIACLNYACDDGWVPSEDQAEVRIIAAHLERKLEYGRSLKNQ